MNNFNIQRTIAGGVILEPLNVERKDLALVMNITRMYINSYYTYTTSTFTVRENAKLYILNSYINGTFTKKRGSVVLADYQYAYALIKDSVINTA